ncbi:MAG: DUF5320 domain-containing protein [Methanoregula sp.]
MPGLNGTGPVRTGPMSGSRGFGRCRMIVAPAQEPAMPQGSAQNIPVYGRGRGGIPCGCGRGFGFSGGRRFRE